MMRNKAVFILSGFAVLSQGIPFLGAQPEPADRLSPGDFLPAASAAGQGQEQSDLQHRTAVQNTQLARGESSPAPIPSDAVAIRRAKGAMAPLRQYLGPEKELSFISWKPVDFKKAVRAGFSTVWLGLGGFLQLSAAEQEQVLVSAQQAGLPALGFIGGDPQWVNPGRSDQVEFVRVEYRRLAEVLAGFARKHPGGLRFSFGSDIEPYTQPWWDGDLTLYSDLVEKVIEPAAREFGGAHPDRVAPNAMIRFEPFWWRNGHVTDDGKVIRGLRDFAYSNVASMTYRDTADQILSVSESVRTRSGEVSGMEFFLGAETNPAGPGIPAKITFDGQLPAMAGELINAIRAISPQQARFLRGVFIHSGKAQADQVLDTLLGTKPAGTAPVTPVPVVSPANAQLQRVVAVARTGGISPAIAASQSLGLTLAARSPFGRAFALRLGGDWFGVISLDRGTVRFKELRLLGFNSSARVIFLTPSAVRVITTSGKSYIVQI